MSVLDELEQLFPCHRAPERVAAWEAIKGRLPIGSAVRGIVVARYPFGVFVDIDAGFPALSEVTRFSNADVHAYTDIERYPMVGAVVDARICGWADEVRQIGLTQLENDPVLARSSAE